MDDPQVAGAHRGARYGAAAGLVSATVVVASDSFPLSLFAVQPGFLYGYWIGIGVAVGAGIGWWRAGRA
jgi:hypothetical protein